MLALLVSMLYLPSLVLARSRHCEELTQPHIIFIIVDDIGYNDVGWNNNNFKTPHIDKLAQDGIILDQFYALPLCTPSRATLLTGLYAQQLGLQSGVLGSQEPYGIPLKYKLFPEILQSNGYSTHAFGKWHLGYCDWRYTPTYRGFDTFLGFYNGAEENYQHCISPFNVYDPISNCTLFDFRENEKTAKQYNGVYSTYAYNDRAVEIIKQHNQDKPLFMYIALSPNHFPVQGDKYTSQCQNVTEARKEFCGAMMGNDQFVYNITEALKEKSYYDNSVIIFVSDNGGSVRFGGNNFPLRGEKGTLHEGGTRVPGFVHSPLLKNTGFKYKGLFHMVDWFATILHLAEIGPINQTESLNQWESISQNTNLRTEFPYAIDENNGTIIGAIRVGDYKFIHGPAGDMDDWFTENQTVDRSYDPEFVTNYTKAHVTYFKNPESKLYNLADDPFEKNNLIDREPNKMIEMRKKFDYYYKMAKPAVKFDKDPAGNPNNFDGVYTPGWCKAVYDVPIML